MHVVCHVCICVQIRLTDLISPLTIFIAQTFAHLLLVQEAYDIVCVNSSLWVFLGMTNVLWFHIVKSFEFEILIIWCWGFTLIVVTRPRSRGSGEVENWRSYKHASQILCGLIHCCRCWKPCSCTLKAGIELVANESIYLWERKLEIVLTICSLCKLNLFCAWLMMFIGRTNIPTCIGPIKFLHPSYGSHSKIIQKHVSRSRILLAPASDICGTMYMCWYYILQSRHRVHCYSGDLIDLYALNNIIQLILVLIKQPRCPNCVSIYRLEARCLCLWQLS